jgi:hypothetical protein
VNIAAQPVQFRDNKGRLDLLGPAQRCGELRAFVEHVGAFSGLNLYKLTSNLQKLAGGKSGDCIPLRDRTQRNLNIQLT